jgi:hypothetical protein
MPAPQIPHTPASCEPNYYQNQAFGTRQPKAARAQQVMTVFFPHGAENKTAPDKKEIV